MWGRGMRLRGGPGRAVLGQGCVGGPLEMQMGSSAPPPPAGCVHVCVCARTLAPAQPC